jgi:hypothetical protein
MSDEPRSLSGYKSKVHEQGEFDNPNEGKPALTEFDEYVLRLTAFPKVKTFQMMKKVNGVDKAINVDKAIIIFEEESTKNEVMSLMRVDSLNFSEDDAFESAIIRFFRKIQHPLREGVEPNWDEYFVTGMRFRARVVVGKDDKKVPNGKYYLDVPTCRPLGVITRTFEQIAATPPETNAPDVLLATALKIVKGCANAMDATTRLFESGVRPEVVQAFLAENKAGKITFPIQ